MDARDPLAPILGACLFHGGLGGRELASVRREGSLPKTVALELTNFCNCKCPFCPLFQGSEQLDRRIRPIGTMSMDLFRKLVGEIAEWDEPPETIYLNMDGEPLLDKMFVQRLSVLQESGLSARVDLQTNGQFLTEAVSAAIVETGVSRLTLGFDGATAGTYGLHRTGCDYDTVLANLRNFCRIRRSRAGKVQIAIQYVQTALNSSEVALAYEMFSKLLDPSLDCFQETFSVDWASEGLRKSGVVLVGTQESTIEPVGCDFVQSQLIVLSDGSVAACCWDYNLTVNGGSLGDAARESLVDIWRGDRFEQLRHRLLGPSRTSKPEKCLRCVRLYPGIREWSTSPIPISEDLIHLAESGFVYYFPGEDNRTEEPILPAADGHSALRRTMRRIGHMLRKRSKK